MNSSAQSKHSKSLMQLTSTKYVIGMLVIIAVICMFIIFYYSEVSADPSYKGFNQFIVIFKFPIALLSMILPVIGLIGINHRSEQTMRQIELASNQSSFSNYYKHLEEFEKYSSNLIEKYINQEKIKPVNPNMGTWIRFLHHTIYPGARNGVFDIPEQIFNDLEDTILFYEQSNESFMYQENTTPDKVQIFIDHQLPKLMRLFSVQDSNYPKSTDHYSVIRGRFADEFGHLLLFFLDIMAFDIIYSGKDFIDLNYQKVYRVFEHKFISY